MLGGDVINLVGPNDGGSYTCNATLEGSYLDTSGGSIDFTSAALDVIVYSMSVCTYIYVCTLYMYVHVHMYFPHTYSHRSTAV